MEVRALAGVPVGASVALGTSSKAGFEVEEPGLGSGGEVVEDCERAQPPKVMATTPVKAHRATSGCLMLGVPAGASKMLVLTEADLFIPMLSFVYGQAQLGGTAAIVSLARLHQRFYGLPENRPLLFVRVRKEALHELGHAYGLTHCEDRLCTMSLSTGIQQLDMKGAGFCDGCAVLLREVTGAAARAASIESGG